MTIAEENTTGRRLMGGVLFFGLFAALLGFHAWANWWWLVHDNHAMHSDDSLHMDAARTYYGVLFLDDSKPVLLRLLDVFGAQNYYPPLLHFVAALALGVFGYSPDVIAGTVSVYFLLLILGCYAIARTFLGRWQALFAAAVVSFTPILYGASRTFMTDYLSAAFAVWAVYCLIRSDAFKNTGWVFSFSVLNGLGIMARQTTPAFYFVPCAVLVVLGFARAFRTPGRGFRFDRDHFTLLLLNTSMTLVVTLGIILPWHLYHYEFLSNFYTTHFYNGQGIFDRAFKQLDVQVVIAGIVFGALGLGALFYGFGAARKALAERGWADRPWLWSALGTLLLLAVLCIAGRWPEYAVFLLSDGVFLPMFLLGALGLFLGASARYRSLPVLILALWLITGYLALAGIFSSRVPRYIIPAVPALALFAALACCAVRPAALRRVVMAGMMLFLGVQFCWLTFGPIPGTGNLVIPALSHNAKAPLLARTAIPILRDRIIAGDYAFRPAQRAEGFDNRILEAMVRDMKTRRPVLDDWANYQQLTNFNIFEGMWFVQRHYWPGDNPFSLPGVTPGMRPLRGIGTRWQFTPEELLDRLDDTDFVVIWRTYPRKDTPEARERAIADARVAERQWQEFFEQRNFQIIDHFFEPAYNDSDDGFYTVLGRVDAPRTVVRKWDFTKLAPGDWRWRFEGGADASPEGALSGGHLSGPFLWLDQPEDGTGAFSAVRVEMEPFRQGAAGRIPAEVESMNLYWARPRDVVPGKWPFTNARGVRFRQVDTNVWEANLARHPQWTAALDQLMIDLSFPRPPMAPSAATLSWDFTRLPKQSWEWQFEKGADRTPSVDGALRMTRNSGPHMQLERPLRAEDFRGVVARVSVFKRTRTGNTPIEPTGMRVFWAGPEEALERAWPFTPEKSAAFEPAGSGNPGYWVADLADHAGWSGAVQRIMISVDVPEDTLESPDEHFSIYTKEIALAGSDGTGPGKSVRVLTKKIELLR